MIDIDSFIRRNIIIPIKKALGMKLPLCRTRWAWHYRGDNGGMFGYCTKKCFTGTKLDGEQ